MHGSDRQAYEPSMTWTCKLITAICSVPRTHTHAHHSFVFNTSMAMALSHEWEHGGTYNILNSHFLLTKTEFPLSEYSTGYSWASCDEQESIYLLMNTFDKQLNVLESTLLNVSFFVFLSITITFSYNGNGPQVQFFFTTGYHIHSGPIYLPTWLLYQVTEWLEQRHYTRKPSDMLTASCVRKVCILCKSFFWWPTKVIPSWVRSCWVSRATASKSVRPVRWKLST